jgi:hypothetical protein
LPPIPEAKKTDDGPALKSYSSESPADEERTSISITNPAPMPIPWHWYEKVAWGFNIGLVVVGVAGIFVAIGTLKTIKRQTDIQRAGMKQWVELVDWKSKKVPDGIKSKLEVSFTLVNPTNLLIVLNFVRIEFGPELPEKYSLVRTGTPLPPKAPITCKIALPVSELKLETFEKERLGLTVQGCISFMSALDEHVTQEFRGPLTCDLFETTLESTMTLRTTKATKRKKKNESQEQTTFSV